MLTGIKEEKKTRKRELLEVQEAIRAWECFSGEINPGAFISNEKLGYTLCINSKSWPMVSSQLEAIFRTRFVPKLRK